MHANHASPSSTSELAKPERHNLVVGLGLTGMSCVSYLSGLGERVSVADSRDAPPELPTLRARWPMVSRHLGSLDPRVLEGIDRVILSPGVDRRSPLIVVALERSIPVIGDVELFACDVAARQPDARVVGVTGTNGKSTVTALIAAMALAAGIDARAGANLGPPALELLDPPRPSLYVLELSSYQLESTESLRLDAALLLNLSPDHLDRYAGIAEYGAAKARIFAHSALAVINGDEPDLAGWVPAGTDVRTFGSTAAADYRIADVGGREWLVHGAAAEPLIATEEVHLRGRHNLANALAALAASDAVGISRQASLDTLRSFAGLAHRMQTVATRAGVTYVNDSKGTNVGATIAAIRGLDGSAVVIAGGDGKGQDFAPLAVACRGIVRHAVLIGRDREALAKALAGACSTEFAADMRQAVTAAARAARPGDVVLLSPACASLDMYKNYAARGDAFADAARELGT